MHCLARVGWPVLLLLAGAGPGRPVAAQEAPAGRPVIDFDYRDGAPVIAAKHLPPGLLAALEAQPPTQEQWREIFPIRPAIPNAGAPETQPTMLGRYELRGGAAVFLPRYPFSPRVDYHVVFHAKGLGEMKSLHAALRLPAQEAAASRIAAVYPSCDTVPANLLKFYIHFTQPMARGNGFKFIRLLKSDGSVVKDPFPEIGVELWDLEQKRFTVLLDPGRIKRGIRINEEMGLPLVPGNEYRLVVDAAWPDAQGNPLAEGFTKAFKVTESDYASPQPRAWKIAIPKAGSRDPVAVAFPESLDAALSKRLIWLVDAHAKEVPGKVALKDGETRWQFTPETPWAAGAYVLRVHPRLEDLAGNQVRRPFEIDVREDKSPENAAEVKIPLLIR